MSRIFVVAEAGACHDGEFDKAQRLVRVAAQAGADAVKFQWVSSATRLAEHRRAPEYVSAYEAIQFDPDWHGSLYADARSRGLEYLCTHYLPDDLATIEPWVSRFKIASFESGDHAFILETLAVAAGRDVLISTGLSQLATMGRLTGLAIAHPNVRLLHCVSAYPAPVADMNLSSIGRMGLSGLSDHSGQPYMGAWAVMAGAQIIEVHMKLLDTNPVNPDAGPHALAPGVLGEYIRLIREAERAYGNGVKRLMPSETPWVRYRARPKYRVKVVGITAS